MKRAKTGRDEITSVAGERVRAFVPKPLPPKPALRLDGKLQRSLESAVLALGRLDAVSTLLPDTSLFLYSYVRKEAVLSSQIEGTQSSLSDLLLFELDEVPGVPLDDVVEVSNYVAALEHGLRRVPRAFRSPIASSARFIACCSRAVAGAVRIRASSAGRRTGSAVRVPATPSSCRRLIISSPSA